MFRHILLAASIVFSPLFMASTSAAIPLGFSCLTNNSAADCATGEAQLSVEVSDLGGGQVQFDFTNAVGLASSITDVYFDDGTLLGIASIVASAGVDFAQNATPGNLPGGNLASPAFVATAGFSLDSNSPMLPQNGVDMSGEVLSVIFDLQFGGTFADVLAELANGDLRIGLHVQAFSGGDSDSFVNLPVPEPGTALLVGLGLTALATRRGSRLTL